MLYLTELQIQWSKAPRMASFKCEHDDDSDINSSYEDERRSCDSEKGILEDDNKIANRRSDISCSIGSDVAQHGAYLKFV